MTAKGDRQDRSESAKERAVAYGSRCFEYLAKSDPDRALADCNEALRLNPGDAVTYQQSRSSCT